MKGSKHKIIITSLAGIIFFGILLYLAVFGRALTQGENNVGIFLALPEVIFADRAVSIGGEKYLSAGSGPFVKEVAKLGFTYTDQMGSGYFFTKDGKRYISTSRMYSSHFMVFGYPKK